ncbi:MAG TPA: hypothetical protein VJ739_10755, partial [Gemmataceae bacterium]|nr:hypothetical protein [Gemmataceae bacterium]
MDTHILSHPDLSEARSPLSVRLPGEPEDVPDPPFPAGEQAPSPAPGDHLPASTPRRWRHGLLLGAAAIGIGAACVSAFLVSPYNHLYPVPPMASGARPLAAQAGATISAPLAPSASLARVPVPSSPAAVVRQKYEAMPREAQLSELLSLHPGAAQADGGARLASPPTPAHDGPPPGYVPHEPGTADVAPRAALPSAPAQMVPPTPAAVATGEGNRDVTAKVIASLDPPT